jgi:ATP-binding cassette subfamily F protein 3
LQVFVDRFRAKATKARQAQSRLKMLAKLEPITTLVTEEVRPIEFPPPERTLSPPIIAVDDVTVGYDAQRPVLQRLSLRVDNDDRIALIGANGNGKSTLVKLLAGRLAPFSGRVTRAERLKVAYFAQHQLDELDPEASAYDHVRKLMPDAPEAKVRARVGAIGFSAAAADTPVCTLSGGEKSRLLLGLATFGGPNLVILDEPTNHLDIDSRAALIEAINDYAGAAILVSHDRYLLDACAERLWLVADRRVTPFDGDLDDYQRQVLSERSDSGAASERPKNDSARLARSEMRRAAMDKRVETASLRKRMAMAEAEVSRLGREISELDAGLADGTLFARDPAKAAALAKARAAAAAALARAEEDWLEAGAALQSAMA